MPQDEERYLITIEKYDDPEWSYYHGEILSLTSKHNLVVAQQLWLKSRKSFLDTVSQGAVATWSVISLRYLPAIHFQGFTRSLPLPVLTVSKSDA